MLVALAIALSLLGAGPACAGWPKVEIEPFHPAGISAGDAAAISDQLRLRLTSHGRFRRLDVTAPVSTGKTGESSSGAVRGALPLEDRHAGTLISGWVRQTPERIEISALLAEGDGARVIGLETVECEPDARAVMAAVDDLARRLAARFPHISLVLSREGERVVLDRGFLDGLVPGRRFDVYGPYPVHPAPAGAVEVEETGEWVSTAHILHGEIRAGDYVFLERASRDASAGDQSSEQSSLPSGVPFPGEESLIEPVTEMTFVLVRGGTFFMGTDKEVQQGPAYDFAAAPAHKIEISDFYLGATEVTQQQWEQVMGYNPSAFRGMNRPVERVSWREAREFALRLSELSQEAYRLPTEAEWEYAARTGGAAFSRVDYRSSEKMGEHSWLSKNSLGETHPVGGKKPDRRGVFDQRGNVWEWCENWFAPYTLTSFPDGDSPLQGEYKVIRGGSWRDRPQFARDTARAWLEPERRASFVGFRLVREAR